MNQQLLSQPTQSVYLSLHLQFQPIYLSGRFTLITYRMIRLMPPHSEKLSGMLVWACLSVPDAFINSRTVKAGVLKFCLGYHHEKWTDACFWLLLLLLLFFDQTSCFRVMPLF